MTLRIRQVKPDYWRDERLSGLSDTDRLVYIGLWMEADDAGWFRGNVTEIATDLFPYQGRQARERKVSASLVRLRDLGRVAIHPCGHAHVPTLTEHQRFASPDKRVYTHQKAHERCPPAGTRGDPRTVVDDPRRLGKVRNGQEREGNGQVYGRTGSTSLVDARPLRVMETPR